MTARVRLPNRRRAISFDIEHVGLRYKATVGFFDNGAPAEIFLSNHRAGNASDVAARDGGILVSLLLQHHCPIQMIARALTRNPDGSASGVIGAVIDRIAGGRP
jgi:hypothetical protein